MSKAVLHPVARTMLRACPPSRDLPAFLADKLGFLERHARDDGQASRLRLGWPTYLLNDPADIEHVLIVNHEAYDKTRRLTGRRGRRLVGDALLTRTGQAHRARRRALGPLFHRHAVTEMVPKAAVAAAGEIAAWIPGDTFDAGSALHGLVLRSRLRMVFSDAGEAELERLAVAVIARQRFLLHIFDALQPLPQFFPRERSRAYHGALRELQDAIGRRSTGPSAEPRHDLISMLMDAREDGRRLSPRELRDEVVTIALTGYETLAALMLWVLYVLAREPEIQRHAVDEISERLGGRSAGIDDLDDLPYVRSVIAETLRLYPPTWIFPRVATRGDRLPSGLVVRPHAKLYLSAWVAHRNPHNFDDVERFAPERFGPGWRRVIRRGAYFPFGAGPHVCIGERLVMAEAILLTVSMLSHWRIELVDERAITPVPGQSLTPRGGLSLRIAARDPRLATQRPTAR